MGGKEVEVAWVVVGRGCVRIGWEGISGYS